MKKILVIISKEFNEQNSIKKRLNSILGRNYVIDIIEAFEVNLINNAIEYKKKFIEGNYDNGLVIWITGVAFTNILNKEIANKYTFTTSDIYTLDLTKDNYKTPDILVLGFSTIGLNNLKYILENYLEKIK